MIEDKNQGKTDLGKLGEFGLIDHLTKNFTIKQKTTIKAVGDDAAVLEVKDKQILVTTDMLVDGVDFDLSHIRLKHVEYKAIIVNLSDVFAMNTEATQVTVCIAFSNRFPMEALEELYAGIET